MLLERNVHKRITINAQLRPEVVEKLIHQIQRKRIIARWNRRVGGEYGVFADFGSGVFQILAALHSFAQQFESQKCRMTFIHVPHRRIDAQRSQRPHAADAQNNFLRHPQRLVAAVQTRRQFTVFGAIFVHVGIHQQQRNAPNLKAPHLDKYRAPRQIHADFQLAAVRIPRHHCGQFGEIQALVQGFLYAFAVDKLAKIALWIQKAHADKRQTEIAGFLAMIARQNPQAARINRQRFVNAKFRREIGDGVVGVLWIGAGKPGLVVAQIQIKFNQHPIILR